MKLRAAIFAAAALGAASASHAQSIEECRDRSAITEMALEIRDAVDRGTPEDSLLDWAGNIPEPGLQAAAYKGIEAYTYFQRPASVSQAVTVMQYMCKKAYVR